jgi:hypothetical protein
MLPATPPKCVFRLSMLNDTFNMCSLSGRMWFTKRSGKTMMWSRATDPDTRIDMDTSGPRSLAIRGPSVNDAS